jgi:hypothetical protein
MLEARAAAHTRRARVSIRTLATHRQVVTRFAPALGITAELLPLSASRLLVIGGVSLILVGMVFGDIYAVFVLHQNAGRIGQELTAVTKAVADGDSATVAARFREIGSLLENRGTKVDAHAHMIAFGYLALLLALAQPYLALSAQWRKRLAVLFVFGAWLLPIGVFLIHYVGLAHSPLASIGWASIAADFGGLLVITAVAGELAGFARWIKQPMRPQEMLWPRDRSWAARALLSGGTLLILAGFVYGAWYSYFDLYRSERQEHAVLARMLDDGAMGHGADADVAQAVNDYGALQAEKAVKIAAHSHIIEFGLLALLLGFVQPLVFLREKWKRRWAVALLIGSAVLPVFVLLELRLGLLAGGIADVGGLMVAIALTAMLVGMIRYTGSVDAAGVER